MRRPRHFASPWLPPPLPPPAKRRRLLLCGGRSRRRAAAMLFGAHRVPRVLLPVTVALGIATSGLVTAAPASASTCWQRVIADWRDGRIDGTYSARCLREAIRNLPEDLRIYGSAEEDINRAMNRVVSRSFQSASIAAPKAATPDVAAHGDDAFPVRAAIVAAVTGLVALAVVASLWRASRRRRSYQ